MASHRPLKPSIQVRVLAPQPLDSAASFMAYRSLSSSSCPRRLMSFVAEEHHGRLVVLALMVFVEAIDRRVAETIVEYLQSSGYFFSLNHSHLRSE